MMCYLGQTVDCTRLTETEWRKEADTARRIGFNEGQIVFGRGFQKGSGLGPQVIDRTSKSTSNTSVKEDAEYQADFAGWVKGRTQNGGSKEAAWKRMSPSLQCGSDQLKFRAMGPGASQFAVEQANAPPLPLSQVPSTCGYIMQRNSFGLVILVPYDGCNMVQKDGSYVLPMRWQGRPVSLWCPKSPAPPPPQYPFGPQDPTLEPETPTTPPPPPPPPPTTTTIALPEGPQHPFKYPFDRQYPTPEAEMTPPNLR
ncbi:MAGE-like protein 2 [Etheostoma cragini]|uniref:MAGE-like protein 2 n=1 Tax=Etheostoma cragini TaxID=417921 RepID=UPI00155E9E36|nr:MAGE-like protein 2 [Etheostoma cragini]